MLSTAGASQQGDSAMYTIFIPMLLIMVLLMFFSGRANKKKQKEYDNMLQALAKGDEVILSSGIHGKIDSVKESTFIVKIDDSTKIEVSKWAVHSLKGNENNTK